MGDEIFDIVNERDEVIGRAPRRQVHDQGLRHRAAHVLLFDPQGRLFLQKRAAQKDRHPNVWDSSAAGHVDSGEDYDTAAVRELHEELGVRLAAPLRRLFKLAACEATGQEFVWVYQGESSGPFVLHPDEIDRGDWFTPEQISHWLNQRPDDFAPTFPVIWKLWLARGVSQRS